MTVFWGTVPCSLVKAYRRFRDAYCLHHQRDEPLIALIMEAVRTSETSVYLYETTRRNFPNAITMKSDFTSLLTSEINNHALCHSGRNNINIWYVGYVSESKH